MPPASYYTNVNPDLLASVPLGARHVLEVGCGEGNFGRAYRARNPGARYVGVELCAEAARQAAAHLDHVLLDDIEEPGALGRLDAQCTGGPFDVLVLGDVLEHLRDPARVLAELRGRVAPGGACVACVPNVAHWSVVQQQLRGRWDYTDAGLLDRTHLRFFTLDTLVALFQQAGWTVLDARARVLWQEQTEAALRVFAPLAGTLGLDPQKLRRDLSAYQWLIRAVNGPVPAPLRVAALGLKKLAGVNEARMDHPLGALATRPGVQAIWGAGSIAVPPDWLAGVFVLHRQFLNRPEQDAYLEALIRRGWVIVSDMDDDPHHWRPFVDNDFYAYRAVHAVSVSTEPLAQMTRQWNPHVRVFPNAIFELPDAARAAGPRRRLFFGALNRGADWAAVAEGVLAAAGELGDTVQFVVVHDQAVFDALPTTVAKEFHPTLTHTQYMRVLASCDIALLPLADTPFNRLKSDLKFIECCAAGAVPICSPVVYAEAPPHRAIGLFATTPQQWRQALVDLCRDGGELARRRALGLEYVRRERMHSQQVEAREVWYRALLAQREMLEAQRQERVGAGPRR